mgnify:CR=1 FL=1
MRTLLLLLCVTFAAGLLSCSGGKEFAAEDPRIREGRLYYARSEFDRAQRHFRDVLYEALASGDRLVAAQAQKWLGSIFLAYEQPGEAVVWYEESLALLSQGLDEAAVTDRQTQQLWLDERHNVLSNIAVVHRNLGAYDRADSLFRVVLHYDSLQRDDLGIALSLNNLGDLYNQRAAAADEDYDSTAFRKYHSMARRYLGNALSASPIPDAWLNLGNNFANVSDLDSAIVCYRQAEEIYRRDGNPVQRALALGNIGVLARKLGRLDEAAGALRASIAIVEELRGSISSIDIRSSFISDKYYIYENLIDILVEADSVHAAFEFVERAKARSFLDMIGSKSVGEGKQRPPEVQALVDREQALQRRMGRLLTQPDSSRRLVEVIEQHKQVLATLREKDPEYASVKSIDPIPAAELQRMLDDSTALVEYFIGREAGYAFLLRRDTVFVKPLTLDPLIPLEVEIERLRRKLFYDFPMQKARVIREQRLGEGKSMEEALAAWHAMVTETEWQFILGDMHARFFRPVSRALEGITQLYIVPHGPLHHLPFQALLDLWNSDQRRDVHIARPRYLIEEYAIAYLPSASVLGFALRKNLEKARTALIVGDPVYADPKYRRRPLEGALIEADTVARYARDPLVLKRGEADEKTVRRKIGEMDLLHFATHGELNKKDPMQSRILLASAEPDSVYDGDLTVAKIFNLDLRAMLVTLSACQTAQVAGEEGEFTPGDELVGLTRSFMYAGSPAVIASLWYVDDAATLAWMRHFYRSWLENGQSRMQAARSAALHMLEQPGDPDWIFPYYWAAFVYMGDSR